METLKNVKYKGYEIDYKLNEDGKSWSVQHIYCDSMFYEKNWYEICDYDEELHKIIGDEYLKSVTYPPELVIPDTFEGLPVTVINSYVSGNAGCSAFRTIRIGKNVKLIDENAFVSFHFDWMLVPKAAVLAEAALDNCTGDLFTDEEPRALMVDYLLLRPIVYLYSETAGKPYTWHYDENGNPVIWETDL